MTAPRISIVILSALRMECTRKCLQSIALNTRVPHEVIVVDMGLDPAIRAWLKAEEKNRLNLKVIFNHENVGTSKGRNQAIPRCDADEIFFLDNDAMVTPGWDMHLFKSRTKWGNNSILGAKSIHPNGRINLCDKYVLDTGASGNRVLSLEIKKSYRNDSPEVNEEKSVPWYATTGLSIRKSLLLELGGFDEQLRLVEEDKDLCLRAKQLGKSIVYCPDVCIVHDRPHDPAYDETIRFGNIDQIREDISFFENRWNCRVKLVYAKDCLQDCGFSEPMIENVTRGKLTEFFTVID